MSLDWSIEQCEDWEELNSDVEWPTTNAVIWATMQVDLGRITEKNVDEFYTRVQIAERIWGIHTYRKNEHGGRESVITYAALRRRIGLNTNVIDKTRTQYMKRISDYLIREAEYVTQHEKGKYNAQLTVA